MKVSLKVMDQFDNVICMSSGEDFADLVCMHTYQEGDRIGLTVSERTAT